MKRVVNSLGHTLVDCCTNRSSLVLITRVVVLVLTTLFSSFSQQAIADNEPKECDRPLTNCQELDVTDWQYCFTVGNGCIPFPSEEAYVQFYEDPNTYLPTVVCSMEITSVGVTWTNETAEGQSVRIITPIGVTHSNYGIVNHEHIGHYHNAQITRPDNNENSCSGATRTIMSQRPFARYRNDFCPEGTHITYGFEGLTSTIVTAKCAKTILPPTKNKACGVGNPCDPSTGFKYQPEIDFNGVLPLTRKYNSGYLKNVGFGRGWRTRYHKELSRYVGANYLYVIEGSGRGERWTKLNGVWQGDADSDYALNEQPDGSFILTMNNGGKEFYDSTGKLQITEDSQGSQTDYNYVDGKLSQVTNQYGQAITFTYSNDFITQVTDTLSNEYSYEYDANSNLISVTHPATDSDSAQRFYHYENEDFQNHLTGVTDENNVRYSTFTYYADGKAKSTEHAETTNSKAQEKFDLDY